VGKKAKRSRDGRQPGRAEGVDVPRPAAHGGRADPAGGGVLKSAELSPTQYNVLRILRGPREGLPWGEIASRMITRDPDLAQLDRPVRQAHRRQLGHLGPGRLWRLTALLRAARGSFLAAISCCNECRLDASNRGRKKRQKGHNGGPSNQHVEHRPSPLRRRVQGPAHDDFEREGHFSGIRGSLALDEVDPTRSRAEASIQARSLDSPEPPRDAHLRSADFFDVENFPTLSFQSGGITRTSEGTFAVEGQLTMHGVTGRVVFAVEGPSGPAQDPWGNTRVGLAATAEINRRDFGLTWNSALETGGILVGDDVTISLDVEFVKA
jgi:polyisoprenoid-binding protein YceI